MKKCVFLLLVLLFSIVSIAAAAEVDFSSYTNAELRALRVQLDKAIVSNSIKEGKAVCNAFIQYMEELGHSLEYENEDFDDEFGMWTLLDGDKEIPFTGKGGYLIRLREGFTASNESYTRDCMVALMMAAAQVEGVEIFNNDISTTMSVCMSIFPDGFYKDDVTILWDERKYGYRWFMANFDGKTSIYVK